MTELKIDIPSSVKRIIESLETAGYEAYIVGGCVRDALLGRIPHDWDITTSARPEQVKQIFPKTVDTGLQHGTVTVIMGGEGYEVTTYRIDGEYEDARHPKEVSYTDNLLEDLKRRDFTINAMAYNETRGLVDEFDGKRDLELGIIRCVGNPVDRFTEDALRMMRAVRFAAQLGFEIHKDTRNAAKELSHNLSKVSAERIMAELTKMLMSDHPDMLRDAYELGLTAQFMPEFDICMVTGQNNPHHCYDVGEHILHTMQAAPADRVLRFTMMLHDIAKPQTRTVDENGITHNKGHAPMGADMAREILRRLRSDNELVSKVTTLILYHDWRLGKDKKKVRRAINKVGVDLFPLLLEVQRADIAGQSDYEKEEKLSRLSVVSDIYCEIMADNEAIQIKDLALTGKDMIEMGVSQGPQIGTILQKLLEHVLDYPEDNTKEALTEILERIK